MMIDLEPIDADADSPLGGDDPFASNDLSAETLEPLEDSKADPLKNAIDELEKTIEADDETAANKPFNPKSAYNRSIFDVPVEVQVIIGSTEMSVSELMALEPNAVVSLNSKIGEPVDIAVNGRKIGEGELEVNANDSSSLCVRITKLGD